jgi:hypothetical protein
MFIMNVGEEARVFRVVKWINNSKSQSMVLGGLVNFLITQLFHEDLHFILNLLHNEVGIKATFPLMNSILGIKICVGLEGSMEMGNSRSRFHKSFESSTHIRNEF